jgi:hypothetical protein
MKDFIIERNPVRKLVIENPKDYQGQFGLKDSDEQKFEDCNYFINSQLNITAGAFINEFFIAEIVKTNIFVGTYPLNEDDVK